MGKKETSISWADLQSMGNPENAPALPKDEQESTDFDLQNSVVRIYLDKKNRRGKGVTLIKGILTTDVDLLKALGKALKQKCGVGGAVKNEEIILQGDHRDKILTELKDRGFKNVKKAGG